MGLGRDRSSRVIVALDYGDLAPVRSLLECLGGRPSWYKVGMELFYGAGWEAVSLVRSVGARVFLDLKFNDIPNTVAGACRSCSKKGASMLNLHALAGPAALRMAKREVESAVESGERPLLIGVTVLTSIDQATLNEMGIPGDVESSVVRLARLCKDSGLDGVVASPLETRAIKQACGDEFLVVVPGIRPEWSQAGDQKRHTTPREAFSSGADYIVIGRPVTQAKDPAEAFLRVCEEIEEQGEDS
jgi:orotidine-5'-phosphate decarboxylase